MAGEQGKPTQYKITCRFVPDIGPGTTESSLRYNGYRVFPGGKVRPGGDADPSSPSTVEVKIRVELYLYSPQGPLWPVKG